jgi:hypothetical protein
LFIPDPGSRCSLSPIPDPGVKKHPIPDPGSGSATLLETIVFDTILKFFDADPGSGMETVRIRDPKWKKGGSRINITDPQQWC